MISPRTFTLIESYSILENLELNTPFYKQISSSCSKDVIEYLDTLPNRSENIAIRFDDTPRCEPKEFYKLVYDIYPECLYEEPKDRYKTKWMRKPHLIGRYESMRELILKLSEKYSFSGCVDYEINNPHYFLTQSAGFNVWLTKDKTIVEIAIGRKTVRSLEDKVEAIIEDYEIIKGSVPRDLAVEIKSYLKFINESFQEINLTNLIIENSFHNINTGKLRKKIVTWDLLPDGSPESKGMINRLRNMFLNYEL
jgi:hypothetical protein